MEAVKKIRYDSIIVSFVSDFDEDDIRSISQIRRNQPNAKIGVYTSKSILKAYGKDIEGYNCMFIGIASGKTIMERFAPVLR